eukprot:g11203.t1
MTRFVNRQGAFMSVSLRDWKGQTSNLVNIIGEMQAVFSRTPPVVQKKPGEVFSQTMTNMGASIGALAQQAGASISRTFAQNTAAQPQQQQQVSPPQQSPPVTRNPPPPPPPPPATHISPAQEEAKRKKGLADAQKEAERAAREALKQQLQEQYEAYRASFVSTYEGETDLMTEMERR